MNASDPEILRLIDAYLDDVITEKDALELSRRLESDPEAARLFVDTAILHGLLREDALSRLPEISRENTQMEAPPAFASVRRRTAVRSARTGALGKAPRTGRSRLAGWLVSMAVGAAVIFVLLMPVYRLKHRIPRGPIAALSPAKSSKPEEAPSVSALSAEAPSSMTETAPQDHLGKNGASEGPAGASPAGRVRSKTVLGQSLEQSVEETDAARFSGVPGGGDQAVSPPTGGVMPMQPSVSRSDDVRSAPAPDEGVVRSMEDTTRPVARLAYIVGNVYYRRARAGKSFRAAEGLHFEVGDSLETRFGRVRLEFEGAEIYCDKGTVLEFDAGGVKVERGTVYCVVSGGKLEVTTPDGAVRHLGTRFLVRVGIWGTRVVVSEGSVELGNDRGLVKVREGQISQVKRGTPPVPPSRTTASEPSWVQVLLPPLFLLDEEALAAGQPWGAARKAPFVVKALEDGRRALCWAGQAGQFGAVYFGREDWHDYRLSVMARWREETVSVRVGPCSSPEPKTHGQGYRFDYMVQEKSLRVAKSLGHGLVEIERRPLALEAGQWHRLEVLSTNGRQVFAVDGQVKVAIADDAFQAGMVELGSRGPCEFRGLRVERVPFCGMSFEVDR